MYSNNISSGKGKDIPDTDGLNIELNFRKLIEKILEPAFNSTLSLESTACRYFTRVEKHPIVSPS
jgi:hypothetical protein